MGRARSFGVGGAVLGLAATVLLGAEPTSAVPAGAVKSGVHAGLGAALSAAAPVTSRLAGADRVGTAVAISQHVFPGTIGSAGSVYLARMDVFADAMAGGSLIDGPVLLVPSCGAVPQVVVDEVTRLAPGRVVALGSVGAVCDQVLSGAAGSRPTARLAGADRYLTALEIAKERARQGPVTELYLANGQDRPDAVVGGQLSRGPILLTRDGRPFTDAEHSFVDAAKPTRVVALGGEAVVPQAQVTSLAGGVAVGRLTGSSRYDTSAAIGMREWPGDAYTVYLARGDVYADAVASGALRKGPVLLVNQCGLPDSVRERVAAARPGEVIALGGTGAVCDQVLQEAAQASMLTGGRTSVMTTDSTGWAAPNGLRSAVSADATELALTGNGLLPGFGTGPQVAAAVSWWSAPHYLVSQDTSGKQMTPSTAWVDSSADGRFVVFVHTPPATTEYPYPKKNVYVRDTQSHETTLVSRTPTGQPGNGDSYAPSISHDGLRVAFVSAASDLVGGDANGVTDVFLGGPTTTTVQLVSGAGGSSGDGWSGAPAISGDGQMIAFRSVAANLVANDQAGTADLVLKRVPTGEFFKVNPTSAPSTLDPNRAPSLSSTGYQIAYAWPTSTGAEGLFWHDQSWQHSWPVAVPGTGQAAAAGSYEMSGDGMSLVAASPSRLSTDDLDSGQSDVFVCSQAAIATTPTCTLLSREFTLRPSGVPSSVRSVSTSNDGSVISYTATFKDIFSADSATGPTVFVWQRLAPR